MFSSHMDMIYKNSALQDIFVTLLFIKYRLSKKIQELFVVVVVVVVVFGKTISFMHTS